MWNKLSADLAIAATKYLMVIAAVATLFLAAYIGGVKHAEKKSGSRHPYLPSCWPNLSAPSARPAAHPNNCLIMPYAMVRTVKSWKHK